MIDRLPRCGKRDGFDCGETRRIKDLIVHAVADDSVRQAAALA
jgi:hypothetical protein